MTTIPEILEIIEEKREEGNSFCENIENMEELREALLDLDRSIGNGKVKSAVVDQICLLIFEGESPTKGVAERGMINALFYGPPGVGKTEMATLVARVWFALGLLKPATNAKSKRNARTEETKTSSNSYTGPKWKKEYKSGDYIIFLISIVLIFMVIYFARDNKKTLIICIGIIVLYVLFSVWILPWLLFVAENGGLDLADIADPSKASARHGFTADFLDGVTAKKVDKDEGAKNDCKNRVTIVSRNEFVDRFSGWTDKKTLALLRANLGKVLVVDEAYSLCEGPQDTYGKEVLNVINLFMSQHPGEIIIVFIGYRDKIEKNIFENQEGLKRRFLWQFDCDGYTPEELFQIFKLQISRSSNDIWVLEDEDEVLELFRENQDAFPAYGGDTKRLFDICKMKHCSNFIKKKKRSSSKVFSTKTIKEAMACMRENAMASSSKSREDIQDSIFRRFMESATL